MSIIQNEVATCTLSATVKQSDLKTALARVAHAVSTRSILPVLGNILIATEGDHLRISATNLEIGMSVTVPAHIISEGRTTIPEKLFEGFIGSLSSGQVDLNPLPNGTQGLRVRCGSMQSHIRGMDPREFPMIPNIVEADHLFSLDVATLRGMIRVASIAYARGAGSDVRPIFTAIFTAYKDNEIVMASADTFRLAVKKTELLGENTFSDMLVPGTSYEALTAILPTTGNVEVWATPNSSQVFFRANGVEMVSRLIDGPYPNYEAVIPKTLATRVVMPTEKLKDILKGAALFARNEAANNTIKVTVTPGQDGLMPGVVEILANHDELGDSSGTVDATVDGPPVSIFFNVKFVADALATIDTPEVVLELGDSTKNPGKLYPLGHQDDCLHVLMPIYSRG